jgi:P4 family phage/plasmid primase-like protien
MIAPALETLKTHRQFILYRLSPSQARPGKTDKFPCDASGRVVSAHDPAHWMSAQGAERLAQQFGNGYGVGFVLTPDSKRFCLDIDNCLQADGQWSPLALQLCAMFPGAAVEVSASNCGLHIWGSYTGDMPLHGCKNEALGIELYTEKRFIALGRPDGTVGTVATDCTMAIHSAIALYFPPDAALALAQEWTTAPCAEWRGPTDDDALIQRAMRSQSTASAFGGKATFSDLWTGNAEALGRSYPAEGRPYDASQADAALAQRLAFWTGKDCERIRRLMERSALARDKWNRADYLQRTILGAVGRQEEVLTDKAPTPLPLPVTAPAGAVALQGVEMSLLQLGTQDSVAQIFARKMDGKMIYNHTRDKWLEWDGTRWQIEVTKKALNFARDLARSVNYEGSRSIGSASFCAGVEQLAKADPVLSVKGTEFDCDNYLLNTPGGTFDLRTNTLRPHDPKDRISLCTAVTPSPDGGAAFDKFLNEITMGDRALAEFLQVSLGACLSGAVESHWMLFWIGQGRNGKNTLGDLVQDAMGDYARKVPTSTLMAKTHEGHPTEIANLQGIRLALSSEINDGEHWNEARINEVTGDGTLSARFMRGDLFTFQRTHKHLIYGNHRPQLRTVGDAIKSRIKIVPFKASFLGREDGDLPRRLRENLGYVMAWLIEGHGKWLAASKRLPDCQAVAAESADYFAAQSTVDMWLAERVLILTTDDRNVLALHKGGDLYRDYSEWKKERGENPVSMTRWAESLRGFEKVKSSGVRYRGLMLIPQVGNVPFPLSPNCAN